MGLVTQYTYQLIICLICPMGPPFYMKSYIGGRPFQKESLSFILGHPFQTLPRAQSTSNNLSFTSYFPTDLFCDVYADTD